MCIKTFTSHLRQKVEGVCEVHDNLSMLRWDGCGLLVNYINDAFLYVTESQGIAKAFSKLAHSK